MNKGFPRLRDRMRYEKKGGKYFILTLACHLHNFRERHMGLSQIMSTFTRVWDNQTRDIFNALYEQAVAEVTED